MKRLKIGLLALAVMATGMTSCLKEGNPNVSTEDVGADILTLQFIENGNGTTINSGLPYFSGGALTYPLEHEIDTADYGVALNGSSVANSAITLTVGVDPSKVLDNLGSDGIEYELMPDSLYHFISNTAVIPAGQRVANMQIEFFPSKTDPTHSYMLPVVITDAAGKAVSSNHGVIYFHTIGNPLAGAVAWDFRRWNNADGSGAPVADFSFDGEHAVFSPVNTTSLKVPTGYYVQPNYLITFDDDGAGNLTNFHAEIAPDEIKAAFTDNGLTVTKQPVIVVSPDYKTITIEYAVTNGAAFRYLRDVYHR